MRLSEAAGLTWLGGGGWSCVLFNMSCPEGREARTLAKKELLNISGRDGQW